MSTPKSPLNARNFDELPHTLTLHEVCLLCCVTRAGAVKWIHSGKLKARQAPTVWLIEKDDLRKFVNKIGLVLTYVNVERSI